MQQKHFSLKLLVSCFMAFIIFGGQICLAATISDVKTTPDLKSITYTNIYQNSLRHAVLYALIDNPEALQSMATKLAAQASISQAISGFLPSINLRAARGRERAENVLNSEEDITLTRTEKNVDIIQPIFTGFRTYNLVRQTKAEYKSSQFNEKFVQQQLALQATRSFYEIIRLKKIYFLTLENIQTYRRMLNKIRLKYTGGAGHKADVDLTKGRLSRRLATLKSVIGARQNAKENFIQIVGYTPGKLIDEGSATVPGTLQQAQVLALKNNPALHRAEQQLKASEAAYAGTKGRLLPTVDIEAVKNYSDNIGGLKGSNHDARAMLEVNYNLFSGGNDIATIERAGKLKDAALHNYANVRREVLNSVANAWHNLQADKKQLHDTLNYVINVKKVLIGYKDQFILGRRSLLNVLDMENEVFNAQASYINQQYAVKFDSYTLLTTIGKLTDYFTIGYKK